MVVLVGNQKFKGKRVLVGTGVFILRKAVR